MTFNEKFEYFVQVAWMCILDLLLGYPKEHTVYIYPADKQQKVRFYDRVWELRPCYTYNKRALSFIKHNYRYGWSVVKAPEGFEKYVGRDNMTEDPGMAVVNMLEGDKLIESFRNRTFGA